MNYAQTLEYLFSQLPMYQRVGISAYKKDLTNITRLCEVLDNPQLSFPTIHIAGTNGKGSVSHALAAVLQQAGYKTGLYISPHYRDFRERIKINGRYITKKAVTHFVKAYKYHFEQIEPSFFEMTVAMAFWYFAQQKVDIAVIETGLGGRLDSTNIITPLLSVITNISYDHMNVLGDTLAQIAAEKAGIIKPNVPAVIGETHPETEPIFTNKAAQTNSPLYFAQAHLYLEPITLSPIQTMVNVYGRPDNQPIFTQLQSDLAGNYQLHNLLTTIQATELLPQLGLKINRTIVRKALGKVKTLTRLIGRWQVLQDKNPLIIADSAHNESGIRYATQQLAQIPHKHLHIVLGVVNDKDLNRILPLLPTHATYYFCKANVPRGLPAPTLKEQAATFNLIGNCYGSVQEALQMATQNAKPNDLVFVGGSVFVVAEVI
ncbi:MAG TPA: folylpolyglutamate synthase/dihydrofolate synthase family protein [Chitinophagales bacterium]|nr:folylpolyglutamate synthase/dihydrofolate synthase family protein [Chitinophagales bacterium]HRK28189.1 folylpolyglutamate synthase/dihydrofolate synthase family protein [Chitinophagales bacterium]